MDRRFKIFGTEYELRYPNVIPVEQDGLFRFGECDSTRKVIQVAVNDIDGKRVKDSELELTKLHEIFHAILCEGQYIDGSNDEPLVEWLARNVYDLKRQGVI